MNLKNAILKLQQQNIIATSLAKLEVQEMQIRECHRIGSC